MGKTAFEIYSHNFFQLDLPVGIIYLLRYSKKKSNISFWRHYYNLYHKISTKAAFFFH